MTAVELPMSVVLEDHAVPTERFLRLAQVVESVHNAEHLVGGVLSGGATLEEVNTFRHKVYDAVTVDEMRELEGYGLATLHGQTWRVRATKGRFLAEREKVWGRA